MMVDGVVEVVKAVAVTARVVGASVVDLVVVVGSAVFAVSIFVLTVGSGKSALCATDFAVMAVVATESSAKLGKSRPLVSTCVTAASSARAEPCMSTIIEPGRTSMHSTLPSDERESVHCFKNIALLSEPTICSKSPRKIMDLTIADSWIVLSVVVAA